MDEASFRSEHSGLLRDLRVVSEDCPHEEQLLAWVEARLEAAAMAAVEEHCSLCPRCGELVELIRQPPMEVGEEEWREVERRLDRRAWPWRSVGSAPVEAPEEVRRSRGRFVRLPPRRSLLALAAGLAALALGLGVWQSGRAPTSLPDPDSTQVRGSGLQVIQPIGDVELLDAFEWSPLVNLPLEYTVEVELAAGEVWSGSTEETRLVAPPELRQRLGREGIAVRRWRVVGRTAGGEPALDSGWVEFRLASASAPASPDEPPGSEEQRQGEQDQELPGSDGARR